jgi:hypothetical protein
MANLIELKPIRGAVFLTPDERAKVPSFVELVRDRNNDILYFVNQTNEDVVANEMVSTQTLGGNCYSQPYSDAPLPGGRKAGDVGTDELRQILSRLGVEGAHSLGRNVLLEKYRAMLAKIGNAASNKAIADFLGEQQG